MLFRSARLVDKFARPAIVLSIKNGITKGSARSIGEVSIYELIKSCEHLLTKFGGHKMAAGLGLLEENIESFTKEINKSASLIDPKDFEPKEALTGILNSQDIDLELLQLLEQFEPYGEANLRPRFLIQDAQVVSIKLMGKDKSHSRIEIRQNAQEYNCPSISSDKSTQCVDGKTLELIAFRTVYEMPESKTITCSYTVAKNEFNNKVSAQLLVNKIY